MPFKVSFSDAIGEYLSEYSFVLGIRVGVPHLTKFDVGGVRRWRYFCRCLSVHLSVCLFCIVSCFTVFNVLNCLHFFANKEREREILGSCVNAWCVQGIDAPDFLSDFLSISS